MAGFALTLEAGGCQIVLVRGTSHIWSSAFLKSYFRQVGSCDRTEQPIEHPNSLWWGTSRELLASTAVATNISSYRFRLPGLDPRL